MILRAAVLALSLSPTVLLADSLTATRVVRANAIISVGDVTVADATFPGALTSDQDITGLEARITLYPGRPIMPEHVGPAALVLRNQPVTLVYQHGGLSIATEGRALSRGGLNDMVKVMNLDSRSTVMGQVRADGSVRVSLEGALN
ncbi:MAG: flagellar basal body P-ring formation chaperone FlgA [Paracoccaceae bacterium]